MHRSSAGAHDRGFTLAELLVVLAIASILLAFSYPPLFRLYLRNQLEGLVRQTAVAMQQARLQAIRNGQPAQVCASEADRKITATLGATTFAELTLPKSISFGAPSPQPAIDIAGACFSFLPDGSVAATGAFRFQDVRENFLEVRVQPQATARVQVRKWDDTDSAWYTRDQGGKPWEWKI